MATNAEIVREKLGEEVPVGGSETDTGFTDEQIADLLTRNDNDVAKAIQEGWQIKAARYADLVDTTEGTSKRAFSKLHEHALRMAATYGESSGGVVAVSRVHQIVRH